MYCCHVVPSDVLLSSCPERLGLLSCFPKLLARGQRCHGLLLVPEQFPDVRSYGRIDNTTMS